MGDTAIYSTAAQQEGEVTYSVISYSAHELPKCYRNLIYASWKRSLRFGNDFFKLIDVPAYNEAYDRYISTILSKIDAVVRLAVLTDDKDVVLGFCVYRGNILDYVQVFPAYRKIGIATQLVPKGIDTITHLTRTALSLWGEKYSHLKFNPFA